MIPREMCAICGVPTHVPSTSAALMPSSSKARFAALRNPECRDYIVGASLSMGGDSIEHVISYWVLFEQFHSPALAGFAVISHWLPSLFSLYTGAWADPPHRPNLIQIPQLLHTRAPPPPALPP